MEKIVVHSIEPAELTEEHKAQLDRLADLDDSEIDTSDIPEWTEEDFERAERGRFYRPREGHIAVDHDILTWLGGNDIDAIRRANAILRDAMERERHDAHAPNKAAE